MKLINQLLFVGDTELRGDQLVRNKLLDLLEEMKVGWTPDVVDTIGERFLKQLTSTLWYLDSHHQKFSSRSIYLPKEFSGFQGFNDWKRKKIKQPVLTSPELECHIQALSRILSQPWIAKNEYSELKSLLDELVDGMYKYMNYLAKKNDEMKEAHMGSAIRVVSNNLELHTIQPVCVESVDKSYRCIVEALSGKDEYDPICLNEIAPTDRYRRRHWLEKIQLPYKTMIYRYPYGNHLGVVSFLWKIPDEVDETKAARLVIRLTEQHKVFASREMRREFLDKYHTLAKTNKSVLRNIYKSLMGDCSAAASIAEKGVDDRVAEALFNLDDPDFIYDLRQLNGNPGCSKFDVFWLWMIDDIQKHPTCLLQFHCTIY